MDPVEARNRAENAIVASPYGQYALTPADRRELAKLGVNRATLAEARAAVEKQLAAAHPGTSVEFWSGVFAETEIGQALYQVEEAAPSPPAPTLEQVMAVAKELAPAAGSPEALLAGEVHRLMDTHAMTEAAAMTAALSRYPELYDLVDPSRQA